MSSRSLEESIYDRSVRLLLHLYGIATAIALWVIAIYVVQNPDSWSSFQGYQYYLIFGTAAVTLFELLFILAFCPICWCFLCCRGIDGWIRAVLYAALTIPVFIFSRDSALACLWAALLLILAFFTLIKSIHQACGPSPDSKKAPADKCHKEKTNKEEGKEKDCIEVTKHATNDYGATSEP